MSARTDNIVTDFTEQKAEIMLGELNAPEKFHLRCPSCNKLYIVATADIVSSKPQFDCVSCTERFGFQYPPQNFSFVETVLIDKNKSDSLTDSIADKILAQNNAITHEIRVRGFDAQVLGDSEKLTPEYQANKACPKCEAFNDRNSRECYSCHVIFEKLEGLPEDKSLRAQPSLVRKWRELASDFSNIEKHESFLMSCRQLDALKFAEAKYVAMNTVQGGDPLCIKMLERIGTMLSVSLAQQNSVANRQRPYWLKYLFVSPFLTSAFMILVGISNLNHRNMIGGGMAISICAAGLIMMIKGRISYEDFK